MNIGKYSEVDNKNENEIKKELINELIEKEKLLQQLITSNSELKAKIEYSNEKFEEIKTKIKNQEKDKLNIETQIKKIENEHDAEIKRIISTDNDNRRKREIEELSVKLNHQLKEEELQYLCQRYKNMHIENMLKLKNDHEENQFIKFVQLITFYQ